MNNEQQMVLDFMHQFELTYAKHPQYPTLDDTTLWLGLIHEEFFELTTHILYCDDLPAIADDIVDLLYVVYGMANIYGLDIEPLFKEVHKANMRKVGGGKSAKGKVLKPKDWQAPELLKLIREQQAK